MIDTVSKLVTTCTFEKVDASKSPVFDVEYLFLQIRGKSVGDSVEINVTCPDDGETNVPVKLNLSEVSIQMTNDQ